MKKRILIGLPIMLLVLAVFMGCSKENLNVLRPNESGTTIDSRPVFNYGSITGSFYPLPSQVAIKVTNGKDFSMEYKPVNDAEFRIDNLPADTYDLHIAYKIQNQEYNFSSYLDIRGIVVENGVITEIGTIKLPF